MKGRRLDERLVSESLAESRTRAQALIRAGRVLVDDVPVEKPGTRVSDTAAVRVRGDDRRYVSRGGEKLAGALVDLHVAVEGRVCLDIGASTGGFADCLLQAGARHVVAVDVGRGQIHERLRQDPRVTVLERTHVRDLTAERFPAPVDLVTADVSFISLRLVLPRVAVVAPRADWLLLVKPQFEVGRGQVGKGGVVRDDALRAAAVAGVRARAAELGWVAVGQADSRLEGPRGNREVFLYLRPGGAPERGGLPAPG